MLQRLNSNQSEDSEKASKLKSVLLKKTAMKTLQKDSNLVQHLLFSPAAVYAQEANLPKRNLTAHTDAILCHGSSK